MFLALLSCMKDVQFGDELPPGPQPEPAEVEDLGAADIFVADGVETEFFLSQVPVPGTIEVSVREPFQDSTFTFVEAVGNPPEGDFVHDADRNSVVLLTYVPPSGSEIRIDYVVASGVQ
jgi:hypothetical protein